MAHSSLQSCVLHLVLVAGGAGAVIPAGVLVSPSLILFMHFKVFRTVVLAASLHQLVLFVLTPQNSARCKERFRLQRCLLYSPLGIPSLVIVKLSLFWRMK